MCIHVYIHVYNHVYIHVCFISRCCLMFFFFGSALKLTFPFLLFASTAYVLTYFMLIWICSVCFLHFPCVLCESCIILHDALLSFCFTCYCFSFFWPPVLALLGRASFRLFATCCLASPCLCRCRSESSLLQLSCFPRSAKVPFSFPCFHVCFCFLSC